MIKRDQKGFTIIELLISTVVFGVILLIITGAIIQFSKLYYKGVIVSRTNEVSRTVAEDMAKSVQYAGKRFLYQAPNGSDPGVMCLGTKKYTFLLNTVLSDANPHILLTQTIGESDPCTPSNLTVNTQLPVGVQEMAAPNMRLAILDATAKPDGLMEIHVRFAYGDNGDIVFGADANGDPVAESCISVSIGGQFCAVADLTTYATRRSL